MTLRELAARLAAGYTVAELAHEADVSTREIKAAIEQIRLQLATSR